MFLKINPFLPIDSLKLFNEIDEIVDLTKVMLTLCRMIKKKKTFKMTEMNMPVLTCYHFKKK